MRKHFLLFALGLMMMALGVQQIQADGSFPENTIWSEDFESGAMPEGWTSVLNGWTIGYGDYREYSAFAENIPPHSGNYNLQRLHENRGDVDTLYLPTLDLSGYTGLYFHCFFMNAAWGNDIDYLEVFYRSAPDASWISLSGLIENSSSEWAELGAPLEASNTATCQLAFVVHDNYGFGVAIDDIYITGERTGTDPIIIEEDGWAHYDNGEYYSAIGLRSDAAFSWGIKIPAGTVTDTYLTKVSLYINVTANATVSIYQGGPTPYEATLLHTQDVTFTQTGVIEVINLMPSVQIDPTQDTWIVFNSPGHAASYSEIENAVNGRWIEYEGEWKDIADVSDGSYVNLAWMIRGHFASEPEYHPHISNIQASDITANSANLTWDGFETFDLRYKKHNPIINNTFQDNDLGEWTTIDADGDGYTWEFHFDPGTGIGSASYINNIGILNPDNYLVSPKFVIGDSITFEAMGMDENDYQEHFGVAVSTTSNTDPAAFTTIWEETLDEDAKKTWKKFTIDLSAYKGQKCYVAIRHFHCTNKYWMVVRNLTFYPNHDPEPDPEWTVVRSLNEAAYALSQLEPDQEYWVEVKAFYGEEATQWSETYKFFTLKEDTGIEQIVESQKSKVGSRKMLHDGQLYILRDGKIFNAQGARVK